MTSRSLSVTTLLLLLSPAAVVAACSDTGDPAAPAAMTDAGADAVAVDAATSDAPSPHPKDDFTEAELAIIAGLGPLPAVPPDPTNKVANDPKAAVLGQMLFFDTSTSGAIATGDDGTNGGLGAQGEKGKVSCASCHGGPALVDVRSKPGNVSLGTDHGTRNALAVVNSAYYLWTNWGGRFDSQWSLPLAVAENPRIMASTRLEIAHMIFAKYKAEYEAVFGALDPALDPTSADAQRFPPAGKPKANAADPDGPWELMDPNDRTIVMTIFANYGKAIQAYMRKLVSGNNALDKFIAGDRAALTPSEKNGLRLFVGTAGCVQCHNGPTLSDGKFHALGVPQVGPKVPATDLGRFADVPPLLASPFNTSGAFSDDKTTNKLAGLAQDPAQRGQFRTPSLRNVALAAPYMHAGQHADLAAVVAFYAKGGGDVSDAGITKDPLVEPFKASESELADLVAFLKALNGEAVPGALTQSTAR